MAYEHLDGGDGEARPGKAGFRPTGRQIVSAVLIFIVVLFALVNLEKVSVDFIVTSVDIPLVFLILASMLLGLAAGWLISERRERREHHKHD